MVLKTERLYIRLIKKNDWKSIKEIWEDFNASIYRQYDIPHTTDSEEVQRKIERWAEANEGKEHMFFAVCVQESVIGYIAFHIREQGYEVGYCFHSQYHGKGYANESLQALFQYLGSFGITTFWAGTALQNIPSVRLLESLGFEKTGEEKVSFYKDEGRNDIIFDGGIFKLKM